MASNLLLYLENKFVETYEFVKDNEQMIFINLGYISKILEVP